MRTFIQAVRVVVVDHDRVLVGADRAVVHLADADAAHILVVVDGADEDLGVRLRIPLREPGCSPGSSRKRGTMFAGLSSRSSRAYPSFAEA